MQKSRLKEAVVEKYLDDFRNSTSVPIWEVKPKDIGGKSTIGKPDRIWLINGGLYGIEAKRIMSLGNKATLPTVVQTKELHGIIEAGGAGCVVDLNSMELFTQLLIDTKYNIDRFIDSPDYKRVLKISNWGRYASRIEL